MECAALRSRMAARAITRMYDEALRPSGLKITQFTLLVAIERDEATSISQLADALGMERTTLTRNLSLLERKNFIKLGPEAFRRSRAMTLTRDGRAILQKALPLWRNAQDELVGQMGKTSWKAARQALEKLAEKALPLLK